MSFTSWLSGRPGPFRRPALPRGPSAARPPLRPALEALEHRLVPSTLTVTSIADKGAGSLRADIAAAQNGDTIVFAPGLDNQTVTLKSELFINKNLTITGPGAGQLAVSGNNNSRVFEVATGDQLNLSGLTVSNGLAAAANGGGILVDASAGLTLSNSVLSGNNATYNSKGVGGRGGGIYNQGSVTLTGCTLSGNCAVGGDSAVYNATGGTLTINNSSVSGNAWLGVANQADATISGSTLSNNAGGGVYNFDTGTVQVSGSTLSGNNNDGGIYNLGSAAVSGCTLSGNSSIDLGGGIYSSGKAGLTVTNSTLSGNTARSYGGGIAVASAPATVSGCTLSGNSSGIGGGIYLYLGTVTISGCTLSGNSAGLGGGICVDAASSLAVSNSRLSSNSATSAGGGLYIVSGSTVTVENSSSITGNTAPAGSGADVNNLGTLYLDASSVIGILNGNPAKPI